LNGVFLDVVYNHLLPNVVCSGVIDGRMRSCNMLETCLNLTGDGRGGVTVNKVGTDGHRGVHWCFLIN